MSDPGEQESGAIHNTLAEKPRPISYFALLAFAAGILGSAAGTFFYIGYEALQPGQPELTFGGTILVFMYFWVAASLVAVPASLVLGTPLLWLGQRLARDHPLPTAVTFALFCAAAAIGIDGVMPRNAIDTDRELGHLMMFAATVAATHVVILYYRRRRSLWRAALVAAFALVLGGAGCRMMLDFIQNRAAERQYVAECRSDYAVIVKDRSKAEQVAQHLRREGNLDALRVTRQLDEWFAPPRDPLLHAYTSLHVGGVRTLVVNDIAYAPLTLPARLGFRRPVRRHCLRDLGGPQAELARRAGLVRGPGRTAGRLPLF